MDYSRLNALFGSTWNSGTTASRRAAGEYLNQMYDVLYGSDRSDAADTATRRNSVFTVQRDEELDVDERWQRHMRDMLFNTMIDINIPINEGIVVIEEEIDQTAFEQILNKEFVYE